MIEINLLPKHYLKGSRAISLGKVGIYVVAGAAGVVLMLAGITVYQVYQLGSLERNIEKASQRAAMLQKDIKLVDALTDVKSKIQDRMAAVERLDRHRSVWVRILEDVSGDVPEFVWLFNYNEKAPTPAKPANSQGTGSPAQAAQDTSVVAVNPDVRPVEIEGYAFTLNALASFMINLMRSDYFDEVELVSTKETKFNTNKEKAYNFVVACNTHYLSDEELQQMIAEAGGVSADSSNSADHKQLN